MADLTCLEWEDVVDFIDLPEFFFPDCGKYSFIAVAGEGNHFTDYGIYEGTILLFDSEKPYLEGHVSCFVNLKENDNPRFKISDVPVEEYEHLGRLVYTVRNYEVK